MRWLLVLILLFVYGCWTTDKISTTKEKIEIVKIKIDSTNLNRRIIELKTITAADTQKYVLVGVRDTQGVIKSVMVNNGDSIAVTITKENKITVGIVRKNKEITQRLTIEKFDKVIYNNVDTNKRIFTNTVTKSNSTTNLFTPVITWLMVALVLLAGGFVVLKIILYK